MSDRNKGAEFNDRNEKQEMREQSQQERSQNPESYPKTENELSLGNSIRNFGDVNGTTFGSDSNPAKFSNVGQKNKARTGAAGEGNIEDLNPGEAGRRNEGAGSSENNRPGQ